MYLFVAQDRCPENFAPNGIQEQGPLIYPLFTNLTPYSDSIHFHSDQSLLLWVWSTYNPNIGNILQDTRTMSCHTEGFSFRTSGAEPYQLLGVLISGSMTFADKRMIVGARPTEMDMFDRFLQARGFGLLWGDVEPCLLQSLVKKLQFCPKHVEGRRASQRAESIAPSRCS